MIWLISDTHFWHRNVLKGNNWGTRPFKNLEEMHNALIDNWNSRVGDEDTVYFLGDFVMGAGRQKAEYILQQLKGNKIILVRGNHDRDKGDKKWKEIGFDEVYTQLVINIGGHEVLLHHYPYNPMLTGFRIFIYKLKNFWKWQRRNKYPFLRDMSKRPVNKGMWLIHGHSHNGVRINGKQINVAVDLNNFTPVSEAQIIEIINNYESNRG